jgi:hypothetical protein
MGVPQFIGVIRPFYHFSIEAYGDLGISHLTPHAVRVFIATWGYSGPFNTTGL